MLNLAAFHFGGGKEEEGRGYCNKGEKIELGTTKKSPDPPPLIHQQRKGNSPISKLSEFGCFRQLSRKFTASFF